MDMVNMKGQVFILIAVMVLIALILLKNVIQPPVIKSENHLIENFMNLKNELIRTVDISLLNNEDVSANLNTFVSFSKEILGNRSYDENIVFNVISYYNTTEVHVNITLVQGNSFMEDNFIINRTVYS
ncbi:hypothetical protein A3K64_00340 [Candidatus Micrarchaeota archaeon RBG_16_36_9]|nr:MAG: hypothetical protein A3K64_00340 [Candidatus Micrarchaeota archaeon RBG_16_36_9]